MERIEAYRTHHGAYDVLSVHRHANAFVAFVVSGGYCETSPDGRWTCRAGDVVLHPPFHLHANRFAARGARVLNFVLPLSETGAVGAHEYRVLRPHAPHRVETLARRRPENALREALAEARIRLPAPPADWRDDLANALIDNPRLRIAAVARELGVSPEHAARAFRRRFGMTPSSFRAERRLRRALQALAGDGGSLAEIAQTAGYADQAHMTRSIKVAIGVVPSRAQAILG